MTDTHAPTGHRKGIPYLGAETMDLLFRLGPLSTEHIKILLPPPRDADAEGNGSGSRSENRSGQKIRHVQKVLAALRASGKVASTRIKVRVFERTSASRWKMIHELTEAGLAFVADRQGLHHSKAKSLYRQVFREALIEHGFLRNDFYAAIDRDLKGEVKMGGPLGDVSVEKMCAESGMTPMELSPREGGGRRYLNPDGLMSFVRKGDPSYHRAFFVESDTGSEDMPWQIAVKADQYAERWASCLAAGNPYHRLERVLFVSPTITRTRWVREVIRTRGNEPGSTFAETRMRFKKQDISIPMLFWFTNLEWLKPVGTLGEAYWSLGGKTLSPLLP